MVDLPLHISAPFTVHYKLHTAHTKKFVNIHVQGIFNIYNDDEHGYSSWFLDNIGFTDLSRAFEFKNPAVQLPDATFKNPVLSKLEWKNLNATDQILVLFLQ